jgi:hypothetical protein
MSRHRLWEQPFSAIGRWDSPEFLSIPKAKLFFFFFFHDIS